MSITLESGITLNNGEVIPQLGLGVYQMPDSPATVVTITEALNCGYRHLDTASLYGNEREVGAAVRGCGLARSDVFVVTKLWNADHGYDRAIRAFHRSLALLGLDYVDLYLIHWPVQGGRLESWRALETLWEEGKCTSIGVSNYMVQHLEEVMGTARVVPAVNQIEIHPFIYLRRKSVIDLCREAGICVTCYSPLTKGVRLGDSGLGALAEKYRRSSAQMLIRWCLQKGFVTIPKSAQVARIRENATVYDFNISDEDIAAMDEMNEGYSCTWDPGDEP
jgi:diketogulonate reductase-like aldo/keto reductase